jgi:hypothetical protein
MSPFRLHGGGGTSNPVPPPKKGIPEGRPDWWGHPDAPWDTSTIQYWVDLIDAVPWQQEDDVWWKSLGCPRCHHQMTSSLAGGVVGESGAAAGEAAAAPTKALVSQAIEEPTAAEPVRRMAAAGGEPTPVWCNCQTDKNAHSGRPDDVKEGCGQNGFIRQPSANLTKGPAPTPPTQPELTDKELQLARPVTDDDRRWVKEATDAQHSGLATVRAAADGWGKAISGILGAFALVAFIKGPQAITDVPTGPGFQFNLPGFGPIDPARTVVFLIFAAAAFVIVAIVCAALAAEGVPRWTRVLDGPNFRKDADYAAQQAIVLLWVSRIFTLIGAALVFGAMTLAWMATIDNAGKPFVGV